MSFGLTVQRLGTAADRALVLGELAGARRADGRFAPKGLTELFEALHLPIPGNVHQDLARLKQAGQMTTRPKSPGWTLTPEGRERVKVLVGTVDVPGVMAEIASAPAPELGHGLHTVVPPIWAPAKWQASIQRMLRDFEFNRNVFCMTRFPKDAEDTEYLDPVREIIPVARQALEQHGLRLHVASERELDNDLYGNIAAHMWACRYGVGLFEDRIGRGLNENMIIEVGSMIMTGRRCALLKDETIQDMPTDFVGHIYKPVDFANTNDVARELHDWASEDLGLGRCAGCTTRR
jgi:hypothetical protein